MVNIRNRNTNTEKNDAENNNAANPPPTLEQVLMMQTQMLQIMQQTMVNMQNAQHQVLPLSYPVFVPKPCTHRMYAQDQLFHTYGQKVFTDNQMSRIKYNYYISNVSKDYDDSQ
jgi:hypothetical protein